MLAADTRYWKYEVPLQLLTSGHDVHCGLVVFSTTQENHVGLSMDLRLYRHCPGGQHLGHRK